jgi:hypothetical protein
MSRCSKMACASPLESILIVVQPQEIHLQSLCTGTGHTYCLLMPFHTTIDLGVVTRPPLRRSMTGCAFINDHRQRQCVHCRRRICSSDLYGTAAAASTNNMCRFAPAWLLDRVGQIQRLKPLVHLPTHTWAFIWSFIAKCPPGLARRRAA